ncbi:MAG: TonB-dependent receptor, partial [Silvibacterium sp.]|nr:TonB-dependent receptor [Silvibacterium sp.]
LSYSTVTFDGTPESSGTKSVEARLAGSVSDLRWVAGFYSYDEDQTDTDSLQEGAIQRTYVKAKGTTEAYAGFGQATYSLTESLRLLGGIRYTHEKKTLGGMDYSGAPSLNCPVGMIAGIGPAGGYANFTIDGRYGADKTNYRAGFEYDAAAQSMLFATVATGFKSGGLSYSNLPPYRAEELTAYTIGSKNRFMGDRLQLNGELFYWDYDNHQESLITQIEGQGGLTTTQTFINAGKASTKGASVDLTARVTNADKIRLSTEYAQSAYSSFHYQQYAAFTSTGCPTSVVPGSLPPGQYGPLLDIDCSGRQLTHAPKWSGNAQFAHDFALGDGSTVVATADVTYATARWLSAAFISNSRAPASASLNLDAAYPPDGSNITLDAFVRNVNNATIYAGGLQSSFVPNLFGASLGAPRTYGGSLRYDF